jgi:hypothetical protein
MPEAAAEAAEAAGEEAAARDMRLLFPQDHLLVLVRQTR